MSCPFKPTLNRSPEAHVGVAAPEADPLDGAHSALAHEGVDDGAARQMVHRLVAVGQAGVSPARQRPAVADTASLNTDLDREHLQEKELVC